MRRYLALTAIVLSAITLAVSAQAVVLTATPSNMLGWTTATNGVPEDKSIATAAIANYGYALAQRDPGQAWIAEDGSNLGKGAFYFTTTDGGWQSTPPSGWLGIDNVNGTALAGVALSRITKLEFYSFVGQFPSIMGGGATDWESWTWRGYPRNPPLFELVVENPDGSGERRTLWYLPWASYNTDVNYMASSCRGDNCGWHTKKWYRYQPTAAEGVVADSNMANRWYCPMMGANATPELGVYDIQWPSWSAMLAYKPHEIDGDMTTLGEWKLVPTSTTYAPYEGQFMSAGWDGSTTPNGTPECTATGMPVNFVCGARKKATHIFLEDNISWLRCFSSERAYVDKVTIGIDGFNTTYNFEPNAGAASPKVVTINSKAAWDDILYRRPGNEVMPAQDKFLVNVVGKIAPTPNFAPSSLRAAMADGYATFDGNGYLTSHYFAWWIYWGVPVGLPQIKENPATSANNKYWSIRGILERPPIMDNDLYPPMTSYIPIWTSPGNMTQY